MAAAGLTFTAIAPEGREKVVARVGDFLDKLGEARGRKPQDCEKPLLQTNPSVQLAN